MRCLLRDASARSAGRHADPSGGVAPAGCSSPADRLRRAGTPSG